MNRPYSFFMIVTCPECLTKFRLDEERIPEGGGKARCSQCQHVFPVQKPASAGESFFSQEETPGELGPEEGYERPIRGRFLRWKWAVLGLVVILAAGGLLYFFGGKVSQQFSSFGKYVEEKSASLKKVSLNLPFLKKYLGMGDPSEGYVSLEKVKGYYLESNTLSKIFVIEGEAVNHWKESRSFIKVKGVLLDSKGNKVQEKEVYSGNILSEKDLKEMSKGTVDKSLSSQFGISFSNVNIQPNKSVPFMIVFMDLPPDRGPGKPAADPAAKPGEAPAKLSDFTVEVISSQKGSK
jgi:predicted Zn finger-like uncharacterized protein